ncbi:glucose-methanol-choline oxidoreductase [Oleiphilus messinensis]|uniref:Glucose-methanol-choline oxidoreductase n=1 Tax=Oleiphilus messinensis TaxID=141451 RepID=A0A1Y0IE84_9GAMM|nr:GMC family oxidoreductase [Oleiphilus messinensis]ARU57684.1 glucose-methanol-choline oxidoreductase [Oleiphilus messinensis]
MSVKDIIEAGLTSGNWKTTDAATIAEKLTLEADVVVVGTGAGGGTTAEILSEKGLNVILVEEGRLNRMKDFNMSESKSYPKLYQEGMGRVTADGAIAIMQGRTVGGSTTVNWTSSFTTPDKTLDHWTNYHQLKGFTKEAMAPWFENRKKRLNIEKWAVDPNANNAALATGCEALGWKHAIIPRNVKACWNLGYCGMGCPTNAKQSMLITTVPGALNNGAHLVYGARAEKLLIEGDQTRALICTALDESGTTPTGQSIEIRAKHFVISASAIGSPALLLRSEAPDPYDRLGKRTFLHPVNAAMATMPEKVDPFYGAPQSVYSDEFVWKYGTTGPIGFKMEVSPLHPGLMSAVIGQHGDTLREAMAELPHTQATIALMRDGFHPESEGGTVSLRDDGSPVLDYPITDVMWQGLRDAYLKMAEVQFAAGAKTVRLIHLDSPVFTSWSQAKASIQALPMAIHRARLFSAHQMGGCSMGENPKSSVVNSLGEHHQLRNLNVIDGSTFPTSIGANPQLSIYGMAAMQATHLANRLSA